MKKEALVSALLLANPVAALAGTELAAAKRDAVAVTKAAADLLSSEFRSKNVYKSKVWVKNDAGDYVEKETEVFYRLTFVPAGIKGNAASGDGYEFDGPGELDYEVLVEKVDVATGETTGVDNTYFVKKEGGSRLKFFDCDSTKRCWQDSNNTKAWVFATPEGTGLKIKITEEIYLEDITEKEALFFRVK